MTELSYLQIGLIGLVFVWSGFVRSGLGFGGSVLSLPLLLLIDNQPLVYLPILGAHLLFFAALTIWNSNRKRGSAGHDQTAPVATESTVDWGFLRRIIPLMLVPKLIGVFGLILLPAALMSGVIFTIVGIYAVSYLINRPFRSNSRTLDNIFLILGAYFSGTSLAGSPLIMAVAINRVQKHRIRDTILALWFFMVTIKMAAFVYAGVDLQLQQQFWLLPCAAVGHYYGLRFHQRLLTVESPLFFRVLGGVLLCTALGGIYQSIASS